MCKRNCLLMHPPLGRRLRLKLLSATLAASAMLGLPGRPAGLPSAPAIAGADTRNERPPPPNVQAAVDKALAWLAKNQNAQGAWPAGRGTDTSVPSLAVMAYLASGQVPGRGPYGDSLNKAIDVVLSQQQDNGMLAGKIGNAQMYEHGISTAMLANWETGYPKLRDALLASQNNDGIWPDGSGQEQEAGDAYRTSMAILALCVPSQQVKPSTMPAQTRRSSEHEQ